MRPAIHAASDAVARTLDAIATAAGDLGDCRLLQESGHIELRRGDVVLHRLATPAHPSAIARMLAMASPAAPSLHSGWQFNATTRQLTREGQAHALTEKESLLLANLLAAHPAACARDALLRNVWGMQSDIETHTLETHIYRLRQKLAELSPKPCDIVTEDSAYLLTLESGE